MKAGKVFFKPIDGSAPLSISWTTGPKGDATEAKNALGVGFFSAAGELLGVIFDDVEEKKDHQSLEFEHYKVEIIVNQGKVKIAVQNLPVARKKKKLIRNTKPKSTVKIKRSSKIGLKAI